MPETTSAGAANAAPDAPAYPDAPAALRALADRFWETYLELNPTWATIIGDRRHDDRLPDASQPAIEAKLRFFDEIAAAARAIDEAGLDAGQRVTRRMLIDEAEGEARTLRTRIHEWTVDPLFGPVVWLLDLVDYHTIRTPEDGRNLVARWNAAGKLIDDLRGNLLESAADGKVAAAKPVERVVDVLDRLLAQPPEAWKLAAPAQAEHDDWSAADLERFRRDLLAAVVDVAVPAFGRFRETLAERIRPLARPDDRPGLLHVPGGEQAYRDLIRVHTTLEIEPEAIHATGLAEIERIDREVVELGGRVLGTKDLASTLAALRDDPRLRFETADEVFETAKRSLERAQASLGDWFGRIPGAACVVVPVPSHSEQHQTIAYYSWPAMDGSRPGRYYINLYAPETRPRYEAEALAFHESIPGHHLQIAIAQELPDLPAFQRALGSTAFAEGWGLYTERLSDEMGLYSSDMDRFGILSYDAWRAGRLVVDTGMHALGWTREQAIDFLKAHTALGENNIVNEVDRYIYMPAQALAYKTGQLEILRLREAAERRLGRRFDIRTFHDTVLGSGAVSLAILQDLVEAWIARTEGRPEANPEANAEPTEARTTS
ncbi:MAG TPA: DUF885 domain-containing protein [Candidatus Binatia bacterium]|nr:DUF885 domain-containing protein [Candidatus Binatia bacterium]